jgi:hypothetical protein
VVSRVAWAACSVVGLAAWMAAAPAHSQSNLDAGKSAAQIFSSTCANCHRSAREIKRTTVSFMREHYTTGAQEAAAMAAYLAGVGSDPKAVEQRRRPGMGAGSGSEMAAAKPSQPGDAQAALNQNGKPSAEQSKPAGPKLRRPAESMEAGVPLAAVAAAPSAERAGAAPTASAPVLDIEE